MNTHTTTYGTLDDGGLSAMMRRCEMMMRKHCPLLIRLPDNYSRQPTKQLTESHKKEIVRLLNTGMNAYQVAKQLGLNDRAVRYYRRYANQSVGGSGEARQAHGTNRCKQAPAGGGSLMGLARASMSHS